MVEQEETSGFRYFLIGASAGLVAGLLLATKPGSELREDIADYTERGKGIARRVIDRLPFRVKAAGVAGAAEGMAREGIEQAREAV
ncbi:MAG: YtxH domain-containing protein [Elusimicrobia bacterium]|nr:YtxH domain-containing protein [Elusimicrobiota bacterium]